MRIVELRVEQFGAWPELRLDDLSDRINVFHGPNEAGKSSLLAFVRAILFGLDSSRRARYARAGSGAAGGWLRLNGPEGEVVVERRLGVGSRDAGHDELSLRDDAGREISPQTLTGLLGNVDERLFNAVFAIGLREIQELGVLEDSAAASHLFDLSSGAERVSLSEITRELAASRQRLAPSDSRPSLFHQLQSAKSRLLAEIEESRGSTDRRSELASRRSALSLEIERHERENSRFERRAKLETAAARVRDAWRKRAALDAESRTWAPLASLSAESLARIEKLQRKRAMSKKRLAELKAKTPAAPETVIADSSAESLARLAPKVEAALERESWFVATEAQLAKLDGEFEAGERRAKTEIERLVATGVSGDWTTRLSDARLSELKAAAEAYQKRRRRVRRVERVETKPAKVAEIPEQAPRQAPDPRSERELQAEIEHAGEIVAQWRRRVALDERLASLARHETDLREQCRFLLDRQLLSPWALVGLGGLFAVGAVLLLCALTKVFFAGWFTESAGWTMAILGLFGMVAAAVSKVALERAAADQLEDCQRQASLLKAQMQEAKQDRADLDAMLPRGSGTPQVKLSAAERDLALLEARLTPVPAPRETLVTSEPLAPVRAPNEARRRYLSARRRWRRALEEAGLSVEFDPRNLAALSASRDRASEAQRKLEPLARERENLKRDFAVQVQRLSEVASELGLVFNQQEPARERLRRLRAEWTARRERAQRRDKLAAEFRQWRHANHRARKASVRWKSRLRSALRAAGVADLAELRRGVAEQKRRAAWQSERESLSREISRGIGSDLDEREVLSLLETPGAGAIDAEGDAELSRRNHLAKLADLRTERDRLDLHTQESSGESGLPSKLFELTVVESQIRESLERFRTLALTEKIIDFTRRRREASRQPECLREASGYFQRLTGGKYVRVFTPLGERALRVTANDGQILPVETLSRGTREQLFLALRLALVAWYSRQGVDLPMVLDDVLVNFDGQRAKAAAIVLRDFASAGHQVLLFTCHEHVLKIFKALRVPAHRLPEREGDEIPRLSARRARAITREPEDEPVAPVTTTAPIEPVTWEAPPEPRKRPAVIPPIVEELAPPVEIPPRTAPPPIETIRPAPVSAEAFFKFSIWHSLDEPPSDLSAPASRVKTIDRDSLVSSVYRVESQSEAQSPAIPTERIATERAPTDRTASDRASGERKLLERRQETWDEEFAEIIVQDDDDFEAA